MRVKLFLIVLLAVVMVSLLTAGCGTALASPSPGPVSLIQDQVALPTGTMANDLPPPVITMPSDTIALQKSEVQLMEGAPSVSLSGRQLYSNAENPEHAPSHEVSTARSIWQANIGKLFSQDAEYEVHEFTNGGG